MSLAVLADHMASKGRGPDSMLIHMSPREVQGLQSLAMAHGGSLTVNPETGLPEAGFLDKLLPTIIGAGLSFIPGVGPLMAAGIVGGIQTVRTGDIGKGLAAGLGAYGGAGLAQGLATAGTGALSAEVGGEALKAAGLTGEAALTAEADQIAQRAIEEKLTTASPFDKLSAGASKVASSPESLGQFAKANAKNLMYAAGPAILAGANVQSKGPQTITKPGMIRPYSFDPYGGTYTAGTPYEAMPTKAADGGLMGMNDGGYSPGQLNFAQRSEPVVRMAEGGDVIRMANGTPPAMLTDEQLYQKTGDWKEAAALRDAQNNALNAYNWQQQADAATAAKAANYVTTAATPTSTASDFVTGANTAGIGLTQPLQTALEKSGLSASAQYALTHDLNDINTNYGGIKGTNFYTDLGYTSGAAPGDVGGLKGLYDNIDYAADRLQDQINAGKLSVEDAQRLADAEMKRIGVSMGDVKAATGKDLFGLFKEKPITKIDDKTTVTGGTGNDILKGTTIVPGVNDYGLGGTGTSGALESVYGPALPPGVSGAGITTVNPNGTITTRPDLSLQMKDVRDTYEKGGGSLGVNKNLFVPKTQDELFARYKNTGGSKAALDYLMGKTPYSPTPYTPTGEIQKPYWESVGRFPENRSTKKYVFVDGKYQLNPDYVKPSYVLAGEKAAALTNQDKEPTESPGAGNKWTWNSTDKKWEAKPISAIADTSNQLDSSSTGGEANGGLMAMAGGGMAGQFDLGGYSDGGRLLRGPGDGVSDSIPATIGNKRPARLADGEFVVPARIVSELGNGSTEAGARKLYAMMDRIQKARRGTVGKGKVAKNSRSDKYLPA